MSYKNIKQTKKGFTLAEVLITLGIIGIVAEMTIPTLMQNFQTQTTVTSLKKAYSVLSSAYTLAVQENGTPDNWDLVAINDPTGSKNIMSSLAPHLKIIKNCGTDAGCFPPSVNYKFLHGGVWGILDNEPYRAKAMLADGSLIAINSFGSCAPTGMDSVLQTLCGVIYVDINGLKGPNTWGYDLFPFYIAKDGIVPYGTKTDTSTTFDNGCKDKTIAAGTGCTAWVMYNENMDYLRCSTLSWDGPTKCP